MLARLRDPVWRLLVVTVGLGVSSVQAEIRRTVFPVPVADGGTFEVVVLRDSEFSDTGRRAILAFHGGGWRQGSVDLLEPHARWFARRGYVVALAAYRRAVDGRGVTDCVVDAFAAAVWIHSRVDELGIDPEAIFLLGESSGGHLAASVAMIDPSTLGISAMPEIASWAGVVLWNPILDLEDLRWLGEDICPMADRPKLSPMRYIRPGQAPVFIIHGREDNVVSPASVERFAERSAALEVSVDLRWLEARGHAFAFETGPVAEDAPSGQEIALSESLEWMSRH